MKQHEFDVVIAGGGAAGMMCAIEAGKRGRRVLVLEHNAKPAEKIRISGGGRCNFTNMRAGRENYLSQNPKFALSALSRYTPKDFVALVERYGISYHEKTLGQLFCNDSAQNIIDMLLAEMREAGVRLELTASVESVESVEKAESGFALKTSVGPVACQSFVVATGGKSIPKMGATNFGYRMAEQFGLSIVETRPALVPLTFSAEFLAIYGGLSGVSLDAEVSIGKVKFEEALLFTHRGLSGPAILQISSFWREGEAISINLMPGRGVLEEFKAIRSAPGKQEAVGVLADMMPKRLAQVIAAEFPGRFGEFNDKRLQQLADRVQRWQVKPVGSEGYRTAEVTLGGVDTRGLDAKTMMARDVPGLYFIGEVVDVTGWLGGYNFQWAWASGFAAGQSA